MSTPRPGNVLDAGASSATKSVDMTEGIHEDVASDLTREHGPSGVKQPWTTKLGSSSAPVGNILDNLGGSTGALGSDAKHLSSATGSRVAAGASSATKATDLTEGIYEDASKGIESARGAGTGSGGHDSVGHSSIMGKMKDSLKGETTSNSSFEIGVPVATNSTASSNRGPQSSSGPNILGQDAGEQASATRALKDTLSRSNSESKGATSNIPPNQPSTLGGEMSSNLPGVRHEDHNDNAITPGLFERAKENVASLVGRDGASNQARHTMGAPGRSG